MIANALIVLGFLVFIFAMSELLLSTSQKEWVNTQVTRAWINIDYLKSKSTFELLESKRNRNIVLVAALILQSPVALVAVVSLTGYARLYSLVWLACGVAFVLWLAPRIYEQLSDAYRQTVMIISVVFIFSLLVIASFVASVLFIFVIVYFANVLNIMHSLSDIIWVGAFAIYICFMLPISIGISMLLPVVFILPAATVLTVLELVTRRIAEYPKGVLVGSGVLLAAIMAAIKTFG